MRLGWPTLYGQKHRARPTPIVNPFPQKFFLAHSCMFKKTSSNDGRRVCVEANQVQRTLAGETAARASGRGARGDVGCAGGTTGGALRQGGGSRGGTPVARRPRPAPHPLAEAAGSRVAGTGGASPPGRGWSDGRGGGGPRGSPRPGRGRGEPSWRAGDGVRRARRRGGGMGRGESARGGP